MTNVNKPQAVVLSFREAMRHAPVDLNLKDDGTGQNGIGYTLASHISELTPLYRDKSHIGAWATGYLAALTDIENKEN